MTSICRFDTHDGRLQMTVPSLAALPALVRSDLSAVEPELLEELVSGGVVTEGALHPRLLPLARCVAAPCARLRLEQSSAPASHTDVWLDGRLGVMMRLPATAAAGDVVAVPRGMVAFRLARLIDLGPRPRVKVADPVELDAGLLEALLAPGPGLSASQIASLSPERVDLIPEWLALLSAVSEASATRWHAGAWWNSAEERPTARSLEVVESEAGSFLIVPRPRARGTYRRVSLYPLTSTEIWRLLCALVPSPEEIAKPLDH